MPPQKSRIDSIKSANPFAFELTESQRTQVEAAFGRKVPREGWKQVEAATTLLTLMSGIKSAAPIRDILKSLRKLAAIANNLRQQISGEPAPDTTALGLEDIHRKYFERREAPAAHEFTCFLLDVLDGLIAISTYAERMKISHGRILKRDEWPQNFSEGEWWDLWINLLTRIMKEHQLPYRVRKDADKRKGDTPSPFVSFVRELQKHVPEECKKFTFSRDALAQAIWRARRNG